MKVLCVALLLSVAASASPVSKRLTSGKTFELTFWNQGAGCTDKPVGDLIEHVQAFQQTLSPSGVNNANDYDVAYGAANGVSDSDVSPIYACPKDFSGTDYSSCAVITISAQGSDGQCVHGSKRSWMGLVKRNKVCCRIQGLPTIIVPSADS